MAKVECKSCKKIFKVPFDGSPVRPHEASGVEKETGSHICPGSGMEGLFVLDDFQSRSFGCG
jgi:hypothetical protein